MVAANGVMARTLMNAGVSSIRRVVRTPERWPRIVELAARYGDKLPQEPNSGALNLFLQKRKASDAVHYSDISLAVIKLMGPGEYVLSRPGDKDQGHFALAALDYTHSDRSQPPLCRYSDAAADQVRFVQGGGAVFRPATGFHRAELHAQGGCCAQSGTGDE